LLFGVAVQRFSHIESSPLRVGEVRSWIKKSGETRKGLVAQIVTRWNQKPITIAMLCSCDDAPTPSQLRWTCPISVFIVMP